MNDYKSQLKWTTEKLLENGMVSRNDAIRNYITRLGAIIWTLKNSGWDIRGKYERTFGGYGRGRDYVYYLISSPIEGQAKKEEENYTCRVCGLSHPKGTREALRDFVYADVCVKHMKDETNKV